MRATTSIGCKLQLNNLALKGLTLWVLLYLNSNAIVYVVHIDFIKLMGKYAIFRLAQNKVLINYKMSKFTS